MCRPPDEKPYRVEPSVAQAIDSFTQRKAARGSPHEFGPRPQFQLKPDSPPAMLLQMTIMIVRGLLGQL